MRVRKVGRRGEGVQPRLAATRERIVVVEERPEVVEKTLTKLTMVRPILLTKGMDLCDLFMDKASYECSGSCPKYRECGCLDSII